MWGDKSQLLSFNSTTVQLIQREPTEKKPCYIWFQFHNGTINTNLQPNVLTHPTMFQFHNGTINTHTTEVHIIYPTSFQFHNGTINTLTNTQKKQLKMSELANNKYAFYMINYVDG